MKNMKGELAADTTGRFMITVVFIVIVAGVMLVFSSEKEDPLKKFDSFKYMALVDETCIALDHPWLYDDRKAGTTDVYDCSEFPDLCNVPIKDVNIYGLYFGPAFPVETSFTGRWDIKGWSVSCEGVDASGNPKTYNLVRWNYPDHYPEGYLRVDFKDVFVIFPTTRALIEPTKSAYEESWKCPSPGKIKVTLETANAPVSIWWDWDLSGTDENVDLCYYKDRKL